MKKLSLGIDSTLGNWLNLCNSVFGENSTPSQFFKEKIKKSPLGENEEVIADERQLLAFCGQLFKEEMDKENQND